MQWNFDGKDSELKIRLVNIYSETRAKTLKTNASCRHFIIPAKFLKELWNIQNLGEKFFIRAEFLLKDKTIRSEVYEFFLALKLIYETTGQKVSLYSVLGNNRVNHNFKASCIAYSNSNQIEPVSIELEVKNGHGEASFPSSFYPDKQSIKCIYFGSYPLNLVRFENFNNI